MIELALSERPRSRGQTTQLNGAITMIDTKNDTMEQYVADSLAKQEEQKSSTPKIPRQRTGSEPRARV